jgi:site-specific recombinase XerD
MKNFKKLVRIALSNGWMDKDPFLNYKAKYHELEKLYLTKEELESIENRHFGMERLNLVKDIFLFSCYTGLAYADVSKLTEVNQVKGIDGEDWIVIDRTKTKARCRIPLLSQAKFILKKYFNHPSARIKGVLLPVLSNQKMNAYLKEIADLCGIEKNLTFHVARHTFATTVTLSNDVPLESVSSMLGHSTTVMTQHYAKVVDKKLSKDVAELRSKMLKTQ